MKEARLQLERDGAELLSSYLTPAAILELGRLLPQHAIRGGLRIYGASALGEWTNGVGLTDVVSLTIGPRARAVRAIFFDKSAEANWALGWHQDRTIAVRERVEHPSFDHWTIKSGVPHVEPPFTIIDRMLTARIHLDAATPSNAPLLIAPRSHRLGRIKEEDVSLVVKQCGTTACLADPGDVWLYRTAILHASEQSRSPGQRRVLQVDFSNDELPGALQWLGIADSPSG